jgi:hypothetical protein
MANTKVEQSHYPNGQLQWEGSFENGKLVGSNRKWHDNGVMSQDCVYVDGLEHGVSRQWNREGRLLGEYNMHHGTGIAKSWFQNGQMESEVSYVRGKLCGIFRCWYEDGEVVSTEYYIMGKKVSKRKYDEACKSDPSLPRYDDNDQNPKLKLPSAKYRQRKTPVVTDEDRKEHADFMASFCSKPNQAEAREWLAGNQTRNVGEMTPEASREVIEEGYQAGAAKIIAVDIQGESTNCLIVELPPTGTKRKRVFVWNNQLARESGFDADDDWGQNELFVYFS